MQNDSILGLMAAHRSVRRFLAVEISDQDLGECVSAAQMASTSSYIQAYSCLSVKNPDERTRLAELCGGQRQVEEAGAFLVIMADMRRHALIAARKGRDLARNFEAFLLAVIDASLFAQNLALALESKGYGICYIGGLRENISAVDQLLELPSDVLPLFGLCAGVPAVLSKTDPTNPVNRPRLPLESVLFSGRYPNDTNILAAVDRFDDEVSRHYAKRGKPDYNWTEGLTRRLEKPLRKELAEYYRQKGARF